jgi:primosomal protein N' (replication factor Y)
MQLKAVDEIQLAFKEKQAVLLKGVTGSGKTVVYTELMKEVVDAGKQVLFLLPEIALTAQLINRLRKFFGNQIGIYHSKFNLHERVEIWHKVLNAEYKIVLGARSAMFLPFENLGLIVVDEEHDSSYKQQDPAPRYQARDSALMLAQQSGAKVILGSATPSVESMFNAEKNKYALVEMNERFGNASLPAIQVVNMKLAKKKKELHGNFSKELIDAITSELNDRKQIILFLNRRGYAEVQQCSTCDFVYRCKNCDVSLTYHKFQHKLICHYCGFNMKPDTKCKSCSSPTLEIGGKGTEQIEEEISELFPAARIARLDLDTMRTKHGFANVIASFENREIDILVGTQMVSKGLDFDNVGLVGILDADRLIYHPGYRSAERAYQLMTQVSGRAGRKDNDGKVILQTSNPTHPIVLWVLQHNYRALFEAEIIARQQFAYPPFTKLLEFTLRCRDLKPLEQASLWLSNNFRKNVKANILGPAIPFVSKINNYYLREILVKPTHETNSIPQMKLELRDIIDEMKQIKEFKSVDVSVDVDV